MKKNDPVNDKDIELLIGNVLRWGVLLSMTVVIFGGVVYLYRHGHTVYNYSVFNGQPDFTSHVGAILNGVLNFKGRSIIQLGIILLIATPIARVLLSAVSFVVEKDYLYVGIALLVLTIITISMLGGFGG
jgi:uncharacterized membrane protein